MASDRHPTDEGGTSVPLPQGVGAEVPPSTHDAAAALAEVAARYPLVTRDVSAGERLWSVTSVENQDALLDAVRTDRDVEQFPYGLVLWASAIGLARWLADNRRLVEDRSLLELGAGVGLPGIVAQALGARVTQTDNHLAALALAAANAERNGVRGIVRSEADWRAFPLKQPFDVVIGSDVLYERTLHAALADLLPRVVAPGGLLVLADPIRHQALEFMDLFEGMGWRFDMESVLVQWEGDEKEVAVFTTRAGGMRDERSPTNDQRNPLVVRRSS